MKDKNRQPMHSHGDGPSKLLNVLLTKKDKKTVNNSCLVTENHPIPNPLVYPYIPILTFTNNERYKIQQLVLQQAQASGRTLYVLPASFQNGNKRKLLSISIQEKKKLYTLQEHTIGY
eukprot:Pgem_evm2s18974